MRILNASLSIGVKKNQHDRRIIKDALALFGLSIALLILAAYLEVWVTPRL